MRVRVGGEERWIAAEDAGLYRDALGVVPPGGLPEAFLEDVPDAHARAGAPLRAHARPVPDRRGRRPLRRRPRPGRSRSSSAPATSCAASCARGHASASGATRTCCAACAARRSPCCARRSSRSTSETLARFLPAWQGVDRFAAAGAGADRLREVLVPLQGLALAPRGLGARRAAAPRSAPTRRPGSTSSARAARSSGSAPGRSARARGASRSTSARTRRCSGPPPAPAERARRASSTTRSASGSRAAPASARPARRARGPARRGAPRGALGPRLGGRGDQRRLRAAARARREAVARVPRRTSRRAGAGRFRRRAPRRAAAAGPLVADGRLFARRRRPGGPAPRPGRADARALRDRHPRDRARRGVPGRLLGALRGALGARDARRRPPRLLRRGPRRRPVRAARRGRAPARAARTRRRRRWSSPRPTRRSPTAPRCPGRTPTCVRRPGAPAPTWSRSAAGRCSPSTPAAGRCACWAGPDDVQPALEALAEAVRAGRLRRLVIDTVDGEPAVASPLAERLVAAGLPPRPPRLRARAGRCLRATRIHHAALRVGAVLAGRVPDAIETPHPRFGRDRWPERLAGRRVEAVEARRQAPAPALRGRPRHPLAPAHDRRVARAARAASAGRGRRGPPGWCSGAGEHEVVQFDGPVLELMTAARVRSDPRIAGLGPDLVAPAPSTRRGSCAACARTTRRARLGDALLDQRIVAGIGNFWKSEGCWLRAASTRGGRSPRSPTTRRWPSCAASARSCRSRRATAARALPRHLRKARLPCPRCGRAGPHPRARTGRRQPHHYWCPVLSALTLRGLLADRSGSSSVG